MKTFAVNQKLWEFSFLLAILLNVSAYTVSAKSYDDRINVKTSKKTYLNFEDVIFKSSGGDYEIGEEVCVDITTRNFVDVSSFFFVINWDTTFLTFNKFDFTNALLSDRDVNNPETLIGHIFAIHLSSTNPTILDDDRKLFTACFTAKAEGKTKISFVEDVNITGIAPEVIRRISDTEAINVDFSFLGEEIKISDNLCEPDDMIFECAGQAANGAAIQAWQQGNIDKLKANCIARDSGSVIISSTGVDLSLASCSKCTINGYYEVIDTVGGVTIDVKRATFKIVDTTPPIYLGTSDYDTIECSFPNAVFGWREGIQNHSPVSDCTTWSISFTGNQVIETTEKTETSEITISLTDGNGNRSFKTLYLTVLDTTPPRPTCSPIDQTVECSGINENERLAKSWNESNLIALKNCTREYCSDIIVTSDYDFNNFSDDCGFSSSLTVTYTISDESNNSTIRTATFSIIDTSDPTVSCDPDDMELECIGNAGNRGNADAWNAANIAKMDACTIDLCSSSPEVTITSDYDFNNLSDNCGLTGYLLVTYTMTDPCGNSVTKTATLTITDTTVPVFAPECAPNDQTINCNENGLNQALAEQWNQNNITKLVNCTADNCGTIRVLSDFDYGKLPQDCDENKSLNVIYTIYDECDNSITLTATLTEIVEEVSSPKCDGIFIQSDNNQLTISNISALNTITKVYDPNWQLISNCSGDCPETVTISDLNAGKIYHTDIQFYDENWEFICEDKQDVEIIGGGEPCDTSVCQGDVILRTQAEVDAFCRCEVIEGDLLIGNLNSSISDISSLATFDRLKKVNGIISILRTNLRNLNGLEQLTFAQTLGIIDNSQLLSLEGLERLNSLSGTLSIKKNTNLENLSALSNLMEIGNQLNIQQNDKLVNLKSLSKIRKVMTINLIRNASLESLEGLENLDSVYGRGSGNGYLDIIQNPMLNDISALSNLKLIADKLTIVHSPLLENCCSILHLIDDDITNGNVFNIVTLQGNAPSFCNSPEEIFQSCQTPPPTCENIQIQTQNNQITIEGLTAPNEIIKVFDTDYNIVYQCVANCADTQVAGVFEEGVYVVDLQLYDDNWGVICSEQRTVILENNGDPCNAIDCETIPPILANIPADLTVECDAIPSEPINITATDNCDDNVTIEFDEVRMNGNCVDNYTLTRTWTASDDCGNTAQSTQTIVVIDTREPTFTNLPPDLTFNAIDGFDTTFPIPVDNCDADPQLTVEDVLNNEETEIVRTFTATDNCGNVATAEQIITINRAENTPCDSIQIMANNDNLTLTNITAPNAIVKVFDPNWQFVYECNATCESELIVPVEGAGIYHTDIQFYDENWQFICEDRQDIEVIFNGEPCDTSICQGDVVLQTQSEVDAFCGCEVIEGNLMIGPRTNSNFSDIISLDGLSDLKIVKGNINMGRNPFTTLAGLKNLNQVGGTLAFAQNSNLESLTGLENIQSIGRFLVSFSNASLRDMSALKNLKELSGLLLSESAIESIAFLSDLETSQFIDIEITNCDNLVDLTGLEMIEKVAVLNPNATAVIIGGNDKLVDLKGIRNIKNVEGEFIISANSTLSDCCSISHLVDSDTSNGRIIGEITIERNANFCNSIDQILLNCPIEPDLSCGNVEINTTENKLSISNLTAPIQIVKVFDNNYATVYECFADCEETINLPNLAAGTYHVNINLYDENWEPICERIESVEVENSAEGRNSDFLPADFALYPNPAEVATYLDLGKLKGEKVQLQLFNQFGQQVSQQVIEKVSGEKAKIDLITLQNGIYFLQIKGEGRRIFAKKLIVNRLY